MLLLVEGPVEVVRHRLTNNQAERDLRWAPFARRLDT
jgi:hypothetical protein